MWNEKITEWLNLIERIARLRKIREVIRIEGTKALCADGKWRVVFCSNDYLGLKTHPKLAEAAKKAIDEWGTGAGASRLITGTLKIHNELENKVCEWLGYESALFFGSGYLANLGVIGAFSAIVKTIFSDRLNHASIIDGTRLAKSKTKIYEHINIEMLSNMLSSADKPSMIVTESVFSMEGNYPDLVEMSKLAKANDALLFVDEAHAIGIYGERGRGLCYELKQKPEIILGTCGKALGSYGAFIATAKDIKDFLINRARTFIFATAPSPSVVAASIAAIELIENNEAPIEKLWENVRYFRRASSQAGLPVKPEGGPIVPIITGDETTTLALSEHLWNNGFWIQPIRPPTVPEGSSRLRITICALHSKAEMDSLIEALTSGVATL